MKPELTGIRIYPVKGAAGIAFDSWKLDRLGLEYDRRWMLVDSHDRFRSQRSDPRLCLIQPTLESTGLRLEAPGMPSLLVPLEPQDPSSRSVVIWADEVLVSDGYREADEWFSRFLGSTCTLVRMTDEPTRWCDPDFAADRPVALTDGFPLLLVSEESLGDLNRRMEGPLSMERFRPNLIVSAGGPYAEDDWCSLEICGVELHVVKPCSRCVVTTVDQVSGTQGPEPLRTLATYRSQGGKVYFGQNVAHSMQGTLSVGSPVKATPKDRTRRLQKPFK